MRFPCSLFWLMAAALQRDLLIWWEGNGREEMTRETTVWHSVESRLFFDMI